MTVIDRDDLAMLAAGFEGALRQATDPIAGVQALWELGWAEVLDASPAQAIATAFAALGTTGSPVGLLDDVMAHALGLDPAVDTCVVAPAPGRWSTPGQRRGERIVVDGTVTARAASATRTVLAVRSADGTELVAVDPATVRPATGATIDPDDAHRRVRAEVAVGDTTPLAVTGTWDGAVAAGRVALAQQLLAASRTMLDQARGHAVDRVQFGRAIASFQAVRHKLAESLVQIEGAAAVVDEWAPDADPLIATLAKSLAGQAARTTATNAQQVLAGIGFTTDHPYHRWLKRTLVLDSLLGSSRALPAVVGAELLARRDAPRLVEL